MTILGEENKKRVIVLGGGESGVGAALLAKQKGYDVFLSDKGAIQKHYKIELDKAKIPFEEGRHSESFILEKADFIVKSPGIPETAPLIIQLQEKGIKIISEIEFASRYANSFIIGITGSNGKTTTASLTYHLLKEAGLNVALCGNIGYSFAKQLTKGDNDYYVLELSSFQLDGIDTFRPNVAVLLNITPDHLDRYNNDFNEYIKSKFRITQNQILGDILIYNDNDEVIVKALEQVDSAVNHVKVNEDYHKNENEINITAQETYTTKHISIKGVHNLFNASCAIQIARIIGLDKEIIQRGLNSFKNVPHRMEIVKIINNVKYINDSKATNVDASYYALDAMKTPIVWIVGGKDKGNDYTRLMSLVENKVKALICLGVDNSKLVEVFSPYVKVLEETDNMKEAINLANTYAEPGDTVLLSPACASFDLFENYEDRGQQFKDAVLHTELVKG